MCLIRIPSETRTSKNEPLRRMIELAADRSGIDQYKVAEVMTWWLEQLADEVSKGRAVQIPGFGAFFPVPDKKPVRRDGVRRCRVRFHAAVGFQQQVKLGAPPQDGIARRYLTYRKNHSAGDNVSGHNSRVFTALAAFRASIAQQLANART